MIRTIKFLLVFIFPVLIRTFRKGSLFIFSFTNLDCQWLVKFNKMAATGINCTFWTNIKATRFCLFNSFKHSPHVKKKSADIFPWTTIILTTKTTEGWVVVTLSRADTIAAGWILKYVGYNTFI